jgi:hypothetical protein
MSSPLQKPRPRRPFLPHPRNGANDAIPIFIAGGVVAVLLLGFLMVARAGAHVNKVALASLPVGVTAVEARPRSTIPRATTSAPFGRGSRRKSGRSSSRPMSARCWCARVITSSAGRSSEPSIAEMPRRQALASRCRRKPFRPAGGSGARGSPHHRAAEWGIRLGQRDRKKAGRQRQQRGGADVHQGAAGTRHPGGQRLRAALAVRRRGFRSHHGSGAYVHPGQSIAVVIDRSTVRVEADVPEEDFDLVKPGVKVDVLALAIGRNMWLAPSLAARPPPTGRREPCTSRSTFRIQVERYPSEPRQSSAVAAGAPLPAMEIPLAAAAVKGSKATLFLADNGQAGRSSWMCLGKRRAGCSWTRRCPPSLVITEGRTLLKEGESVQVSVDRSWREGLKVTGLSLRNPIAILMICIGLVVFALVVTPRMSVDTFPSSRRPCWWWAPWRPGLGPKDVEKTITWRIEKYVSATPALTTSKATRATTSASSSSGSSGARI